VYDWFRENVRGGPEIFDALISEVAKAEAELKSASEKDL
jgi:hypothetical protein